MGDIGEIIRKTRQAKGMTQGELARRCGMADSAIRKYESSRQTPKISTIQRIAIALDVPVSTFLRDTIANPDDTDFLRVCEYTGLSEQATLTITNGIRTFEGATPYYTDERSLIDILNSLLEQSTDFLTMLVFIKMATTNATQKAVWGEESSEVSPSEKERKGYSEKACAYLLQMISNVKPLDRWYNLDINQEE